MAKAYNSIGWENGTKETEAYVTINGVDYEVTPEQWDGNTPVDATNLDHMEKGIENSYDVEIIAYTDTAPSECTTGDIYYNTTNKLLYKATGTNTWSSEGYEPLEGILYVLFDSEKNQGNSYAWNGTDLSSVGGGGGGSSDIIIVEPDEPTEETKLLIEEGDLDFQGGTEITNNYSQSTTLGYSANYVNGLNTYSTTEQRIGTWMGKPLYKKTIYIEHLPNNTSQQINHNISNIDAITNIYGVAHELQNIWYLPLPASNPTSTKNINISASTYVINIATGTDRSNWEAYVTLEYTKTTD